MYYCDQGDHWVLKVTKQFVKKRVWANPKAIYQTCDDCGDAIVKQAARFEKELELEREKVFNAGN